MRLIRPYGSRWQNTIAYNATDTPTDRHEIVCTSRTRGMFRVRLIPVSVRGGNTDTAAWDFSLTEDQA